MTLIKNPVLLSLQSLIGIAPSPKPVVLDDENVSLTLPLVPDISRRSRVLAGTQGWFQGVLENVHSAADDENVGLQPYNLGIAAIPPFPAIVGPEFDIHIAGASMLRTSGTGALTIGSLSINVLPQNQGFGLDDAGAVVVATPSIFLARFDAIQATQASSDPGITEQGLYYQPINMRLPRGASLSFASTSAAAATYQMLVMFGLFPAGLGQDVAF